MNAERDELVIRETGGDKYYDGNKARHIICCLQSANTNQCIGRPKYSSNHIIMLHCYSNAAINKKEVYLHHIPRDIQVAGRHLDKPHSTTNLPH